MIVISNVFQLQIKQISSNVLKILSLPPLYYYNNFFITFITSRPRIIIIIKNDQIDYPSRQKNIVISVISDRTLTWHLRFHSYRDMPPQESRVRSSRTLKDPDMWWSVFHFRCNIRSINTYYEYRCCGVILLQARSRMSTIIIVRTVMRYDRLVHWI